MNFKLPWYFALAFIVCWPAAVFSQTLRWQSHDGTYVHLFSEPCTDQQILKWLKPDFHHFWKAGVAKLAGVDGEESMCWRPHPDRKDIVWSLYDDGSNGPMPRGVFKEAIGI